MAVKDLRKRENVLSARNGIEGNFDFLLVTSRKVIFTDSDGNKRFELLTDGKGVKTIVSIVREIFSELGIEFIETESKFYFRIEKNKSELLRQMENQLKKRIEQADDFYSVILVKSLKKEGFVYSLELIKNKKEIIEKVRITKQKFFDLNPEFKKNFKINKKVTGYLISRVRNKENGLKLIERLLNDNKEEKGV